MKKTIIILLFAVLTGLAANLAHPVTPLYIRQLNIQPYMFGLFYTCNELRYLLNESFLGKPRGFNETKNILFLIGLAGYGIAQGFLRIGIMNT